MAKNTGVEYEVLVKEIFEQILKYNLANLKTLKIEHDVYIKGNLGTHQIDVYWEFEFNGIKYKTVVQAKDWNSNVPQEKILAFNQILQDIPGQPRGIFITKTGYQKGAREIAEKLNIVLYELRKPTDKDWEGKMRDLKIILHGICPHLISCTPIFDKEYLEEYYPDLKNRYFVCNPIESNIVDFNGQKQCSFMDLLNKLMKVNVGFNEETEVEKMFDEPLYLLTEKNDKFKVKGLIIKYIVRKIDNEINIKGDNMVGFILCNVLDKTEQRISPQKELIDKSLIPVKEGVV